MPTIRLEQVTKQYRNGEHSGPAISGINLTIAQGEFIFLVGSRGAGKSTLLDVVTGAILPDGGKVYLDDARVRFVGMQRSRLKSLVGRVPQKPQLVRDKTVRWNLTSRNLMTRFEDRISGEPLIRKSLGLVGMAGVEGRYPLEFSYSDCRRIELAKAIMHSPALLVLDEVTDRMDDDATWDLLHLLSELNAHGTTVLMVTNAAHFINIMRKRVIKLADGKIVSDVAKGRYDPLSSRRPARGRR